MIYRPHPWQKLITGHQLDINRSAQWASMGAGKSVSTLTSIDAIQMSDARPWLVLAPLRVAQSTWPDETRKWDHLSHMEVQPATGSREQRIKALKNNNAAVFTCNYENLPFLVDELGDKWPFASVVADESSRLKSFRLGGKSGRRARSLGKIAHTKIERFWELTGTPAGNGLADLWAPAWFLDAGQRLGRTFTSFTDRWFRQGFNGFGLEALPFAQEQIQEALRDICLTVNVGDYLDIEKPIVNVIRVELPGKARALYRDMERRMFMDLGSDQVEAFNAAARTIKCLQLANGAAYVGDSNDRWVEVHDAKLQALQSITEEAMGAPVMVAYHFKSDLRRLQRAFPYGRVLDADPATIRDWNAGAIRLLFAHPASAGHGLNLQDGGNILVFFGHWWGLEEHQQIIERIGPVRQKQAGHDRPVFIHHIVASDTVDELVMARRETKREVQDLLLEAMKSR